MPVGLGLNEVMAKTHLQEDTNYLTLVTTSNSPPPIWAHKTYPFCKSIHIAIVFSAQKFGGQGITTFFKSLTETYGQ